MLRERAVERIEERYSRQVLYPGIGERGQRRLAQGHVAVVGCGATGAAAAALLARAGVGILTLVDRDFVEESNLQRQVLFDEADAREALPKAEAARRKIAQFNSQTEVRAHVADLVPSNIHALLGEAAILLDATDNFETRYLLNDYAIEQGRPWIYAAAVGAYAATMNILPGETACLACLFPRPPVEVTEALKFLVGAQDKMRRTLLGRDLWTNDQAEISAATPRAQCPVCQQRDFAYLRGEDRPQITLCGRNSVQIHEHHRPVDFAEMRRRLEPHGKVNFNRLLLRFERGDYTVTVFADGRALVQGTTDITVARSLYARFIGS
jgi:molybdopterin/thiamine biosynthesis adenylyltransferase